LTLPFVDIVILNHNGIRFLDECIQSVFKSTYPNLHVYLLDNASTESDVAYVEQKYPSVRIIRNPLNNGYCAAYNLAFSVCESKYIVCLNNDVSVNPGWIEPLVSLAESDPSIGALQPKIVSYFDSERFEYAGACGGMMDIYGYPFLQGRIFDTIEKDEGQYNTIKEIFWASGASIFLRREALEHSGWFDETIVHHMDEIDLCWRLRIAGYRALIQPKSVIKHIGGATIQTHSFKKVYWNHRNSIYIMIKNYGLSNMLRRVPVHVLLDYIAVVQALFTFNFVSVCGILAAHLWLILNITLMIEKRKAVQALRTEDDASLNKLLYKRSVVWEYFILRHHTSNTLTQYQTYEYRSDTQNTERAYRVTA
jgi:GT2 family glycosyltransferase